MVGVCLGNATKTKGYSRSGFGVWQFGECDKVSKQDYF